MGGWRGRTGVWGFAALVLAQAPSLAQAQVAGPWSVSGQIAGTPFAVDCRFEPQGSTLGGVCVETAAGLSGFKAGKVHVLKAVGVEGRQVRWSYEASFLLAHFDVVYSGTVDADHMAGTVAAAGRKGAFTAVRK